MTRQKMIKTLEKIHDALLWESNDELTDHTKSGHIYLLTKHLNAYRKTKSTKMKQYKILLVEDGSIDVNKLEQFIDEHNLKIKIVVYRAGSVPPCFLNEQDNELWRR